MDKDYRQTNWWNYVDDSLRDLMKESFDLVGQETARVEEQGQIPYHDYAYLVFPAAKAYEGFLKKVFLELKLLTVQQYYSDHFRIGRALSPTLPKMYRSGWVFGKLNNYCGGEKLPLSMWNVWKEARNRTFHFFPQHRECVTLEQAKQLVIRITEMMEEVLTGCRVI